MRIDGRSPLGRESTGGRLDVPLHRHDESLAVSVRTPLWDPSRVKAKRVLLVVSHAATRAFIARQLRRWAMSQSWRRMPTRPSPCWSAKPFVDVAMIDDDLALADGQTLSTALRGHGHFGNRPLILLSAVRKISTDHDRRPR